MYRSLLVAEPQGEDAEPEYYEHKVMSRNKHTGMIETCVKLIFDKCLSIRKIFAIFA